MLKCLKNIKRINLKLQKKSIIFKKTAKLQYRTRSITRCSCFLNRLQPDSDGFDEQILKIIYLYLIG